MWYMSAMELQALCSVLCARLLHVILPTTFGTCLQPWHFGYYRKVLRSLNALCFSCCIAVQGLKRIKDSMADETLDAPGAPAAFEKLLAQAAAEGWLPPEMAALTD
jgi:hypothetical protein